jgi:Zn-dependent protease
MRRSLRLGQVAGIEVQAHISCAIYLPVFALLGVLSVRAGVPLLAPAFGLAMLVFFISVFFHELGHGVVARRLQVPVRQITLWAFGGFTHFERPIETPRHDVLISLAGPLANAILAALSWPVSAWLVGWLRLAAQGELPHPLLVRYLGAVAVALLAINLVLAVTNILPIYPLDGGRILRAVLHARLGERRANRLTLLVSLPLAAGQLALGLFLRDPVMVSLTLALMWAARTLYPDPDEPLTR